MDFCVLKNKSTEGFMGWITWHIQSVQRGVTHDLLQGEYLVSQGPAQAVHTVFGESHSETRLDGHKLLSFFHKHPVLFPCRLLKTSFSKISKPMPIPHGEMPILKHLYREDWWLETPHQAVQGFMLTFLLASVKSPWTLTAAGISNRNQVEDFFVSYTERHVVTSA